MSHLMQVLMDYACNEQVPRHMDHLAYEAAAQMEDRHLALLREGLSEAQCSALEKLLEDRDEIRSLELQAMFLSGFSLARELGV